MLQPVLCSIQRSDGVELDSVGVRLADQVEGVIDGLAVQPFVLHATVFSEDIIKVLFHFKRLSE